MNAADCTTMILYSLLFLYVSKDFVFNLSIYFVLVVSSFMIFAYMPESPRYLI
jgi:hypothetical protein